jgi:hypothetical protein
MLLFLWGGTALGCWAIGLLFLQFWRRSGDRLFGFFAAAFWMLSANWLILAISYPADEVRHWVYAMRIVAFLILIAGILDKNRPRCDEGPGLER